MLRPTDGKESQVVDSGNNIIKLELFSENIKIYRSEALVEYSEQYLQSYLKRVTNCLLLCLENVLKTALVTKVVVITRQEAMLVIFHEHFAQWS